VERLAQVTAPDLASFSSTESNMIPERGNFRTLSAPVTIQWEVTPWCNERCVHCYNYWRDPDTQKLELSTNTDDFFDASIREIISNRIFHVTLTGGEPLAVFKTLFPYLERLSESNTSISLNSNLTMLTKEKAARIKSIGIRSILTSLMSSDPDKNDLLANRENTFNDVVKGINIAQEEGIGVAVNMVVTKVNIQDIYSTAEFVKSLGVRAFSATKASSPIRDIDFSDYSLSQDEFKFMLGELLRVKSDLKLDVDSLEFYPICSFENQESVDTFGGRMCNAGKTACTIGYNGQVRPCSHASQEYGSIFDAGGLSTAWLNMQPWRDNSLIPEKCKDCDLSQICRGGCRTEAFVSTGNLNGKDPYCLFNMHPNRKTKNALSLVNEGQILRFNNKLKYRDENFGAIIYHSPTKWLPVDNTLKNFYLNHQYESFNLEELAVVFGAGLAEVTPTAGVMLQKSLIERR